MKWFDKWFDKKVKQAWENQRKENYTNVQTVELVSRDDSVSIDSDGMNFKVYRANGGYIIETKKYDKKHDEVNNKLHIVTDDKDLGQELGKIITFENLRS